jgi:mannose-6-phosphate isomerase-like protein (cupin superfamily)
MDAYELEEIEQRRSAGGRLYEEFLSVGSMSAGLYVLEAGATDPQSPHDQDEIYHVVSGRGRIQVAGEDRDVGPGSVIFVPAQVEHRFHSIDERLEILVFFAPAETS